jgi:hypothetical protein
MHKFYTLSGNLDLVDYLISRSFIQAYVTLRATMNASHVSQAGAFQHQNLIAVRERPYCPGPAAVAAFPLVASLILPECGWPLVLKPQNRSKNGALRGKHVPAEMHNATLVFSLAHSDKCCATPILNHIMARLI